MSLPIFRAVGGTYGFVFSNIPNLVRVLWLPFELIGAANGWFAVQLFHALEAASTVRGDVATQELAVRFQELSSWSNLIQIGSFLVLAIATAGVLKPILRGEWTRWPFYFQLGLDEWRLIGALFIAYVVRLLFIAVAIIICLIVVGLVGFFTRDQADMGLALLASVIACAIAIIWVDLRLTFVAPTSIALEKIGFSTAWDTSRGEVWHLFGFWLLMLGPVVLLAYVAAIGGVLSEILPLKSVHFPHQFGIPPYLQGLFLPVALPALIVLTGAGFVLRIVGTEILYRLHTDNSAA